MTEHEIRKIVAETVDQTLTRLGVDTENPIELQRDLQHLRDWRLAAAAVKKQGLVTAVGIIVAGILGLMWLGLKGS